MIKHINHQNVTTTPFVAAKARVLSNIQNDDTVILEPNAYANGTNISLDYIDYNSGDPVINKECDIALEQQTLDSLGYEEGITGSANFNSSSDARNADGTYQTLVHRQTKNAFYNSYHNPTEIFGVEHIDFPLSKTLRNLADHFRMFSIPRLIFGDKIQPKSVHFYDTLLDDNVEIFDDGYQNLIAGYNLFSKVQEVRTWPSGSNEILPGTSSCICVTYDNKPRSASVSESGSLDIGFISGSLATYPFTDGTSGVSPSLFSSFYSASLETAPFIEYPSGRVGYLFGSVANEHYTDTPSMGVVSFLSATVLTVVQSGSFEPHDSASITSIGFYSGSLFDTVVWSTGSQDSASVAIVGFYSGSLFQTLVTGSTPGESGSITSIAFYSASVFNTIVVTGYDDYASVTNVGFYTASVWGAPPP